MTDQNDFIKLLFDTLKETTDDNTEALDSLVKQQMNLVSTVEKMPISDIRDELKTHVTDAHAERNTILDKVNDLSGKVKLMIGVVSAAIVITGIVYVIGRYVIDYTPKQQMTQIEERIHEQQKHEHDALIEAVREEVKKFHPEADKDG